jgi:Flp pilus assembly pilin Flp
VNALVVNSQILVGKLAESLRAGIRFDRNPARGQGLAEYALILALIAIIAIIALLFLGGQISMILSTVGNSV